MKEQLIVDGNFEEIKSSLCFQLWGYDVLSEEKYLCGVYRHASSANRARRRLEAEDSSGSLPDKFWVRKTTWTEHLNDREDSDKRVQKIRKLIMQHKRVLISAMPMFKEFVKTFPREVGRYEFPLATKDKENYLNCLAIDIVKRYRSKKKYDFSVGLFFSEEWDSARFTACTSKLPATTLDEIRDYRFSDKLFDELIEGWYRQIEKFFQGSY